MFEVSVEETFAAGHALRHYRGKCENVHGHNYRVQVTVEGEELNPAGLLVDFTDLKRLIRAIVARLDHQFLNDLAPFDAINPSAENMARYFYEELSRGLDASGARIREVRIWETDITSATFRPTPSNS
ncbi:MAG TPA: 6-carboxytetrahydropterin synthase QueD [Bryobacteraceae bacterium]|nr:6-carboxytetrahydropterin synthase QueD [Bryobacteraceae bacterium]